MKNKFPPDKKLMQYAISAAAFLATGTIDAEVVYVDVDPDNTIGGEGGVMLIDINDDGVNDFKFTIYSYSGAFTYSGITISYGVKVAAANALVDNEFLGTLQSTMGYTFNYIPIVSAGEEINSTQNFVTGTGSLAVSVTLFGAPYYSVGNWGGAEMSFLGFRLVQDGSNNYGWMRLSVSDDGSSITLHDYAYQTNAEQGISAGQLVGVDDVPEMEGISLYSFGKQMNLVLTGEVNNQLTIEIYSLDGKIVKQLSNSGNTQTVDCSDLVNGNYIVRVTNGAAKFSKQLFIGG